MTDVTRCPEPDTLLVLLYDDEGTPEERAVLQDHVDRCLDCADVLTSLDTARGALGAWHAPRLPLGFALVRLGRSPVRTALWGGGLAAAAILVLAAAASLAQFDISYDSQGLRIRTGVSRSSVSAIAESRGTAAAGPALATARPAATPATEGAWVGKAAAGEPPWRADLDLLATQIRGDVARLVHESRQVPAATAVRAAIPAAPAVPGRGMTDAELLKRVQDLLDQSEIRQQSNLALRVTELGRQFELARQSDIVQVEQTLQRIEQQRGELLRRVSSTQPRP
jgi:hypothetical protein